MLWIQSTDVGDAALARMRRDGVVTPLTGTMGAIGDGAPPGMARARAVAPWVPRRAAASGLVALWAYGLLGEGPMPGDVAVVVPRGAHPDPPPGVPHRRWAFSTHDAAYTRSRLVHGVRLVTPADAAASALGTGPLAQAIPAVYRAVATGAVAQAELREAVCGPQSSAARMRARSAWRTVQDALEGR